MSANHGAESKKIDSEKSKDIRQTNIIAAKGKSNPFPPFSSTFANLCFSSLAVADVVRTSLGPRGMDKMVSPESSATNCGAINFESVV